MERNGPIASRERARARRTRGAFASLLAALVCLAVPASAAAGWEDRLRAGKDPIVLTGVDFKGVQLVPASDAALKPLAAALRAHPGTRIRIEVHVDSTDPVPVPLSKRRADAIAARLKALGAPAATILEAKGMGGAHPLVPSLVESMKAKNRRATIQVVVPPPAARPAVAAATPRPQPTPAPVRTPAPAPVATPAPAPPPARMAAAPMRAPRVVVVASDGLAGRLGGARAIIAGTGARVVQTAQVQESRAFTCVYHTEDQGRQARALARVLRSPGIRLVPVGAILPDADVMVVLGGDLR